MGQKILIAGFGGQGVMTLGKFLAESTCKTTEKNVTFFPSYGAEQRGGTANCYVTISDNLIGSPVGNEVDDLIVLNSASLERFLPALRKGGRLFVNSSIIKEKITREDISVVSVPCTEISLELGNSKALNIVMLGAYVGYTRILPEDAIWQTVEQKLRKKAELLKLNRQAYESGLRIGKEQITGKSGAFM